MPNDFVMHLLENSLVISIAIFLLWGLSHLLRKYTSAKVRLACWLVVAVGLLLPIRPVLYTVNLADNATNNLSAYVSNMFEQTDSAAEFFARISGIRPEAAPTAAVNTAGHAYESDGAVSVREYGAAQALSAPVLLPDLRGLALFIVWGMGAFIFLSVCAFRYGRFVSGVRRWSRPVTDESLSVLMEDVCREVKLRRNIRLCVCPLVTTPVAIGLWNPIVILPDEAIEYRHLRLILFHEALHFKRGDIWFKAISLAAVAVNWFNPFAYLMNRSLSAESELACDADVLRYAGIGQSYAYGEIILHTARQGRNAYIPLASASFSGGGKSLKRRLSAIVERKTVRRWVSVCCAAVMICSVLLTGLAGCDSKGDIASVKADMTPTNELTIYTPPLFENHWRPVIERYKELYPDVNVTVEEFVVDRSIWNYSEVQDGYTSRLTAELTAGKGPDVIFLHSLYSPSGEVVFDIYKMMDSGRLLDLKETLEQDKDFNRDDYFAKVLDAGIYKGRQYTIPISFDPPVTYSNVGALEQIGLDISQNTDISAFIAQMLRCMPAAEQTPGFSAMMLPYQLRSLFDSSGLMLIDYENKKMLPDENSFRAFCESYKPYYEYDVAEIKGITDVVDGSLIYQRDMSFLSDYIQTAGMIEANGGVAIGAIRGMDGKLYADTVDYVSINAASKNQLNAYNFIKLLISPEMQLLDTDMAGIIRGLPIHKDSFAAASEREWKNMNESWIPGQNFTPVSQEQFDLFTNLATGIDSCILINFGPSIVALDNYMTPYFKGEKSYEDCVAELKSKLGLYLSE